VDDWVIWLAVGGAIGLMMNLIDGASRHAPLAEVLAGMGGAALGGWLLTPLVGPTGLYGGLNGGLHGGVAIFVAVMVAVIGAETVLAVFRFARRRIEQGPRHRVAGQH
jgi:uncharacterized membrane protein YeaQ/YmgE (transglycosylase-associated protein family)